jgi:hypothetical protein
MIDIEQNRHKTARIVRRVLRMIVLVFLIITWILVLTYDVE